MRSLIAIGVNRVQGAANLPALGGAASGAEAFARWARDQGFDACSVTDAAGPVTVQAIKERIGAAVKSRTCTQLVIYFAGHGILKSADTEMWLLSDAASDANAAVNLVGSIRLGRNCGIPHLVFISDACRSLAADPRLSEVTGSSIFPIEVTPQKRPEVDVFYATLPGDVSWEVPAADAARRYDGIFTKCMLKGLMDPDVDLVETVPGENGASISVISSRTLKPWLEERVPDAISNIDIKLTQFPEVRVESQRPKYLAVVTASGGAPAPPTPAPTPAKDVRPGLRERLTDYLTPILGSFLESVPGAPSMYRHRSLRIVAAPRAKPRPNVDIGDTGRTIDAFRLDADFYSDVEAIRSAQARPSFETETGFSFAGAEVLSAEINGQKSDPRDVFREGGQWHVRVDPQPGASLSALIQFMDGSGTCLAVIPGYIGSVVVESGRVVNVSYTPSQYAGRFRDRFQEFADHRAEIEERRAIAAAAAKRGYFRVEPDKGKKFGEFLRQFKALDPTLGIYAAYAYAQSGLMDNVDSVYQYMDEVAPFDVALLAGKLEPEGLKNGRIAPFCPMLTQGWALLDESVPVSPAVRVAAHYLKPALWTTLTDKGVEALRNHA
jgi:hypothetical protein